VKREKRKMKREKREGIKLLGCARGDWRKRLWGLAEAAVGID